MRTIIIRGDTPPTLRAALPVLAAALLLAPLITTACSQPPAADVIAADGALCDITRRLAADDLRVSCLLGPSDDPHQLQLTPRQSRELRAAKLVLINGYGLTPALEKLPQTVKVAERAVPQSPMLTTDPGPDHPQQAHDPELGTHHHGDRDPHVWHDPRQAAAMVRLVSAELQRLSPRHGAAIQNRAQGIQTTLAALHRWNQRQFATIPGRPTLASGHRAFASLARAYRLNELSVLDADSASSSLRPQQLTTVLGQLRQQDVRSLFAEQLPAPKSLARISALSHVPIAPSPLLADHAGENLMRTLTSNTCLIVEQLGGQCDRQARAALQHQWDAIR